MKYDDYESSTESFAVFLTPNGCVIARGDTIMVVEKGMMDIRYGKDYAGVCGNRNDACRIAQQIRKGKFDFRKLKMETE